MMKTTVYELSTRCNLKATHVMMALKEITEKEVTLNQEAGSGEDSHEAERFCETCQNHENETLECFNCNASRDRWAPIVCFEARSSCSLHTYKVLFFFERPYVFNIRTHLSELPDKVCEYADLVLKDAPKLQVMKDRSGLFFETCVETVSVEHVLDWLAARTPRNR